MLFLLYALQSGHSEILFITRQPIKLSAGSGTDLPRSAGAGWYLHCFTSLNIAGHTNNPFPLLWKNGRNADILDSSYNSLCITYTNGKVYTGGCYTNASNLPCFWIDGVRNDLPYYGAGGQVSAITVSDGSVYSAGTSGGLPVCWKDQKIVWSEMTGYAVNGISVYNNDIYIYRDILLVALGRHVTGKTACELRFLIQMGMILQRIRSW